jgi:hypothetical protein
VTLTTTARQDSLSDSLCKHTNSRALLPPEDLPSMDDWWMILVVTHKTRDDRDDEQDAAGY